MKKTLFILLCITVFVGCKTRTLYVPVESVKTEYQDRWLKDSVFIKDSIRIYQKGDTVFYDKFMKIYIEKQVRDSIFITDSIQVPYPVVEYKDVYKQTHWQIVCNWFGKIFMGVLGLGLIILMLKWKRLF